MLGDLEIEVGDLLYYGRRRDWNGEVMAHFLSAPPTAASAEHKSLDPIYCAGCGMLADTFCECGFTDNYRGVA